MSEEPLPDRIREIGLWGFRLHPMTGEEVVDRIASAVSGRRRLIMANLNLHGMAMMYESPPMARLHAQPDCQVMIDGMPILFFANLCCGARLNRLKRTTSLDYYDDMFARGVARGWTFAYVGATQWVLERGLALLRQRFPGLSIEGRNGYFDMNDGRAGSPGMEIIDWIAARSPDVVIVGMGMPRQEEWISLVQHKVDARVFLPAGAYLDYQVGVQRPPPRWLGRYGLEGVYRFLHSPFRLGHRYLVEPVILAARLLVKKPLPTGTGSDGGGRGE